MPDSNPHVLPPIKSSELRLKGADIDAFTRAHVRGKRSDEGMKLSDLARLDEERFSGEPPAAPPSSFAPDTTHPVAPTTPTALSESRHAIILPSARSGARLAAAALGGGKLKIK